MAGNKDMFEHFIKVLEEAGAPYCILGGYDDYPDRIGSDVDFMVAPAWSGRLPVLIACAASRSRAHLVQSLRHETTAVYFIIARLNGSTVSYLHPDSSTDYRCQGRRWMKAEDVLARRRRHHRGFWIPSAADAFAYYLIKKIDKGELLTESQSSQLTRRYREDPAGARSVLNALLPESHAEAIELAARSGSWSGVTSLRSLRPVLNARVKGESLGNRMRQTARAILRLGARVVSPTGLHVVFLGPDGSGKSTLISAVCSQMERAFRRVHYQHLRPRLVMPGRHVGVVNDPHGKPPRGVIASIAKLLVFWLDFAAGAATWFLPKKVRSTLLVFDRYFHDILADPRRYRYGGPLWLARCLGRLVPQPDLVFILDAPPSVLQARKKEITLEEGARQRTAYLGLQSEFANAKVIDVAQPIEKVVTDVLGHIIAFQEARTVRRLGVGKRIGAVAIADPAG